MTSENPVPENNPTPNTSREPYKQPDHPQAEVSPAFAAPKLPPSHAHYQVGCKTEKNWWDKGKPFVEIAGMVLLGIYTGYTIKMYCANKKAADAARDAADSTAESVTLTRASAHLDQRAWLAVEDIPGVAKVGDFFSAVVHVKNSGKTPAINERFSIALNNTLPKVDIADVALECIQANAKPERTIVAPGGTVSFPGRGEKWGKLKPGWLTKLGTKKISIYGCVLYDDIFPESHWLTFCGYWKDDIKAFDNCEVGDATGDGNGPAH